MAFAITPSLGVNTNYVGGLPFYDPNSAVPSPQLGSKIVGNDGHEYVFVRATANIAAATAVIITEPAMTAAGGAGTYSTQAGLPVTNGQYFWARSNAQ